MRFLRSCRLFPRTRGHWRSPWVRSARGSSRFDDAGFGFPEIVVAIGIVFVTLLALAHTLTASFSDIGLARQRQGANALANRTVELARALPHDTLRRGLRTADLASDPSVVACAGAYRFKACSGEPLVHTAGLQSNPPLVPNRVTETLPESPTRYDVTTYLTSASAEATGPLRLIVNVAWDQNLRAGAAGQVTVETIVYSPKGCVDQSTHPFAAPCQPFFYGIASAASGAASVSGTINGTAVGAGFETPSVRADMQGEQVQHVHGAASATRLSLTGKAPVGAESVASSADDDPATAGVPGSDSRILAAGSAATLEDDVGGNALSVFRSTGSSGTTIAATSAGGPAPDGGIQQCSTTAPDNDGEPCGYHAVRQDESVGLGLDAVGALGAADLASLGPAPSPTVAQIDRDTNAGDGQMLVNAERSYGELKLGGLPTGTGVPPGWLGYWIRVTPYRGVVTAAIGDDTSAPTASVTDGSIEFWNGKGYTSVALASAAPAALTVTPLSLTNVPAGTDRVDVSISGSVRTGGRSTKDPDGSARRTESAARITSPVVADVGYALVVRDASGLEVLNAQLTISVHLGSVSVQADYREASGE